jgi:fatty-acyl-CoA synthase
MTANLSRLLAWHRPRCGGRDALVFGARRTTYAELDDQVDALARGLRELGVGTDDRVGMLSLNSDRYVVAILATAKLGAVFVPLNVRLAAAELAAMVDEAELAALFVGPAEIELGEATLAAAATAPPVIAFDGDPGPHRSFESLLIPGERLPHADRGLEDLQRIQYSSGTTSRPKGVEITHGQVIWNFHTMIMEVGISGADTVVLSPPLYHAGGLDIPGLTTLYVGATWVIDERFRVDDLLASARGEEATGLYLVSPVIEELIERLRGEGETLDRVRWIMSGGLVPKTIEATLEVCPNARLIQGYGMTETLGGMVYMDAAHTVEKIEAQGSPVRHLDVVVAGPDGAALPAGEEGEVLVRGAKVSPGYWRDAEKTTAAQAGDWLHTGDRGRFDADGYLYFVGREKDMIKSGGENIALAEVERALLAHPEVVEAGVIGVADERWGEVPKAFVVAPESVDFADLEAHCEARVAKFKVPRQWERIEALPWNHSGKIRRDVLAAREPDGASEAAR